MIFKQIFVTEIVFKQKQKELKYINYLLSFAFCSLVGTQHTLKYVVHIFYIKLLDKKTILDQKDIISSQTPELFRHLKISRSLC